MNNSILSNGKKSLNSTMAYSTANATLNNKMAEVWLRQNHIQYQKLLIQAKELQLSQLEQQSKSKKFLKNFQRKKKEIDELQKTFNTINEQLIAKKNYLHSYYQHLNDKLKSNVSSISLFSKIQALSSTLNEKLQSQKKNLQTFVIQLRKEILKLEQEKNYMQSKRQNLKNNLISLRQAKENFKSEQEKKREEQKKRKIEEREYYEFLQSEFQKQLLHKKELQKNETILKKLLDIQQVHKKNWLLLQKAIKNQFTQKASENYYKQSINMQYRQKAQEKEQIVQERKKQLQGFIRELAVQNKKKQDSKNTLEISTKKFNEIQAQLLAAHSPSK